MLPFYISRMFGLQSKKHGVAIVDEKGIKLVFREATEVKLLPGDEADQLTIEWTNLIDMRAIRGIISDQLELRLHQMIGDEPDGKNDNVILLELQKRERDKLERFEESVRAFQSGGRRDDVDDVLDDVRDLLDRM